MTDQREPDWSDPNDYAGLDDVLGFHESMPDAWRRADQGGASTAAAEPESERALEFHSLQGFLALELPPAESLVGVPRAGTNLLPRYGWVMTWGPEGSSKTTVGLDLMCHAAAGQDWLGYPISRPCRFVVVINEGIPGALQDKLREKLLLWSAGGGDPGPLHDNIAVFGSPWGEFQLSSQRMRSELRAFALAFEADYCYLDPLHTLGTIGAGSPQDTEQFKHWLRELGVWGDLGVITPHHQNKRGMLSGDWGRHPDTLIHIQKDPKRQASLWTVQKARPADPAEHGVLQVLEWLPEQMSYKRARMQSPADVADANRAKVLEALSAAAGPLGIAEISAAAELSRNAVSRHVKSLEAEGAIRVSKGPRGRLSIEALGDDLLAAALAGGGAQQPIFDHYDADPQEFSAYADGDEAEFWGAR